MCKPKHKIKFCTCNIIKTDEDDTSLKKVYTTEEMFLKRQEELNLFLNLKKTPSLIASEKAIEKETYLNSKVEWLLQRYRDYSSGILGITRFPSNKINDVITSEYILELLNSNVELFDFEYLPKEKDILYVTESYEFDFIDGHERPYLDKTMYFKYENNNWIEGRYSLSHRFKTIADGEIKEID